MQSKKKQRNKRNKGHTFKNKTEGGDKGARLAGFVKDGASALRMQLQKRRAPTKLTSAFKSVATNIKNKAKMALKFKMLCFRSKLRKSGAYWGHCSL